MIDSVGGSRLLLVLLGFLASCVQKTVSADVSSEFHKVDALMPDYTVDHEEAYLCTAVPLPDKPLKLVGIEPLSTQEVVHHMLLFGELLELLSTLLLGLDGIPSNSDFADRTPFLKCRALFQHV